MSSQSTKPALLGQILFFCFVICASRITFADQAFDEAMKKAEAGGAVDQHKLGQLYEKGEGVAQSYAEAAKWYLKAATQGYVKSQSNLGNMYTVGQGVKQDYKEAAKWYGKAAEQGYAKAQYNLGVMYDKGRGVDQKYKEAVKWFTLSAEQDYGPAQFALATMYSNGFGVKQNFELAYVWATVAPTNGNEVVQLRELTASKLSSDIMRKATEMAASVRRRIDKNKPASQ